MADERGDYGSVKVPRDLKDRLEKFVDENTWGYRSQIEVTSAALREFLQKYEEGE